MSETPSSKSNSHGPFDDSPEPTLDSSNQADLPAKSSAGKRTAFITGAVLGGLLVLGGGAYATTNLVNQASDKDIAKAAPKSTSVFFEVDLNPSNEQKTSALSLAVKLDKLIDDENEFDAENKNIKELVSDPFFDDLDYANDVEPWIGDKAAVASWGDFGGYADSFLANGYNPNAEDPGYEIDPYDDYYDDAYLEGEYDNFYEEETPALEETRASYTETVQAPEGVEPSKTPSMIAIYEAKDTKKAEESAKKAMATEDSEVKAYTIYGDYLVIGSSEEAISEYVELIEQGNLTVNETYTSDRDILGGDNIASSWIDLGAIGIENYADAVGRLGIGADEEIAGRVVSGVSLHGDGISASTKIIGLEGYGDDEGVEHPENTVEDMGNLSADSQFAVSAVGLPQILTTMMEQAQEDSPEEVESMKSQFAEVDIIIPDDFTKLFGSETGISVSFDDASGIKFEYRAVGADYEKVNGLIESTGVTESGSWSVDDDGTSVNVLGSTSSDVSLESEGLLKDNELFQKAVGNNLEGAELAGYIDLNSYLVSQGEANEDGESYGALGVTSSHDEDENITDYQVRWVF